MNANDRAVAGLVMVGHASVHVYEMVIPLFVVSWLVQFQTIGVGAATVDVTTASVGVVVTVGYVVFGVGALPAGVLVDRIGSRRLITACLFGMGGAYVLLGLAPNMLVIGAALLLWGAAASVYHPSGLSLISKAAEDRGTVLAVHGMAGNLGIGLGPLAAAVALVFLDWRTLAIAMGIPAAFAGLYALRAEFDEQAAVADAEAAGSAAAVDSLREFLTASRRLFASAFLFVFVVTMCSGLYYRGFLTFLPELLGALPGFSPVPVESLLPAPLRALVGSGDGRTLAPQDYVYAGLLLVGMVGQYAGGKLSDRPRVAWFLGGAFATLGVLALAFLPAANSGLGALLVVSALLGVFLFMVQPMYQALVAEFTPAGTRGLSYGFSYAGVFGVGALGGAIAGAILTFSTTGTLFLALAGFAAVAALMGVVLARV